MGLLNYIKGTIKENYDLEDIEDIEDIDDFVYDDEQNTGEEQNADNSRTEDLTGLVSEFEKNYQKHEKKANLPTSFMPSVQPLMTRLSGNSAGSLRSYDESKTLPLRFLPS